MRRTAGTDEEHPAVAEPDSVTTTVAPVSARIAIQSPVMPKTEPAEKLANAKAPPPLLHPNMVSLYAPRIGQLYEHLQDADGRTHAAQAFRSLFQPGDAGAGQTRTGHRPARRSRRDPALCGGQEEPGFPGGSCGPRQSARLARRISEAVSRTAKKPPRRDLRRFRNYPWLREQDLPTVSICSERHSSPGQPRLPEPYHPQFHLSFGTCYA